MTALKGRAVILCIDETGDRKKGKATDYTAKQYIGNLGKTAHGIVSVNAYALVDNVTFPLLFKVFKPRHRLKPGELYQTKPQIAEALIRQLQQLGFSFELVLADSLYGESGNIIKTLKALKLSFIVAIRSNHGVLLAPGQRLRYNRWRAYQQQLSGKPAEQRFIRKLVFGKRRALRYFEITKADTQEPGNDTWFIMTNLTGAVHTTLAQLYSLRNWIEYGFKQVKNELGWADFRLTDYGSIERWWEIIFSAYLLVSLQTQHWKDVHNGNHSTTACSLPSEPFRQHRWWQLQINWKSTLNNLRLLMQPWTFYHLLVPWLELIPIPGLRRALVKLIRVLNQRASPSISWNLAV